MENKTILVFGTRKKADYLLYISHVIKTLNKRVLIVDLTQNEVYRNAYTRLKEDENLFDYQGIDILVGANGWGDVSQLLKNNSETLNTYDLVLLDVDRAERLNQSLPEFKDVIYMGDFERDHLVVDAKMIAAFHEKYPKQLLRRITFGSKYKINADTFESYLTCNVKWNSIHILFEAHESIEELRLEMQHQLSMPFNHINSVHRDHIVGLVSELYQLHVDDVKDALKGNKPSLFKGLFKRTKKEKPASTEQKPVKSKDMDDLMLLEKN